MNDDFAVQVAVAIINDAQERHLWVWNDKWGSFALPMSKLRRGPLRRSRAVVAVVCQRAVAGADELEG